MKFALALVITAFAALTVWGQAPTLHIVTEIPNLPSELYYGNIKVKPLRLRPGTNTPITINDSDFFVNQQYTDFLSRFPDQSGFDFWVNQIQSCNGDATCIAGQRDNTSGAFFLSIEFQETRLSGRAHVQSCSRRQHRDFHVRRHASDFRCQLIRRSEFLPDSLLISNGVIIGKPGADALWRRTKWPSRTLSLGARNSLRPIQLR